MADPNPTDPAAAAAAAAAARRAERARRNGARSRGPATERGKGNSSRNALRHGLTAKVHLVLDRDDEADFHALAGGLERELAPRGPLEGFLVARLTAAMWHTGRAERLEARAFLAGGAAEPDPDRLRLALRYRGSVQRELFRCLRALQELRRCPGLAPPAAGTGAPPAGPEPGEAAAATLVPPLPPADLARVAVAAWGGARAGPIPPGFMELRPVPDVRPTAWRFYQERAFPGDTPLLVYADGTVRSPDGELLEDAWNPAGPLPPSPAEAPPVLTAELGAAPDWLDDEDEGDDLDDPAPIRGRRNEPTQPLVAEGVQGSPALPDHAPSPTQRIGLGRTLPPELEAALMAGVPAAAEPPAMQASDAPLSPGGCEADPLAPRTSDTGARPGLGAWERIWGIAPPEPAARTRVPERGAEAALPVPAPAPDTGAAPAGTPPSRPGGGRRGRRRRRGSIPPPSRWRRDPSPAPGG